MKKNVYSKDFDYYIDEYMYNCRSRKLRPKTMMSYEQTLIDGNCAPIQRIVKKIHMSTDINRIKSVFFRKAGQVTAIFIKTGCF